jgi:hypothetical protein
MVSAPRRWDAPIATHQVITRAGWRSRTTFRLTVRPCRAQPARSCSRILPLDARAHEGRSFGASARREPASLGSLDPHHRAPALSAPDRRTLLWVSRLHFPSCSLVTVQRATGSGTVVSNSSSAPTSDSRRAARASSSRQVGLDSGLRRAGCLNRPRRDAAAVPGRRGRGLPSRLRCSSPPAAGSLPSAAAVHPRRGLLPVPAQGPCAAGLP